MRKRFGSAHRLRRSTHEVPAVALVAGDSVAIADEAAILSTRLAIFGVGNDVTEIRRRPRPPHDGVDPLADPVELGDD